MMLLLLVLLVMLCVGYNSVVYFDVDVVGIVVFAGVVAVSYVVIVGYYVVVAACCYHVSIRVWGYSGLFDVDIRCVIVLYVAVVVSDVCAMWRVGRSMSVVVVGVSVLIAIAVCVGWCVYDNVGWYDGGVCVDIGVWHGYADIYCWLCVVVVVQLVLVVLIFVVVLHVVLSLRMVLVLVWWYMLLYHGLMLVVPLLLLPS